MERNIIKKRPVKFIRRFVKLDMAIYSFWILAGIVAFILTDEKIENRIDFLAISIMIFLGLSLFIRLLQEYSKERKTITGIKIELDNLQIELLDFDSPTYISVSLANVELTLSRSFQRGNSRFNIDFWTVEKNIKKKLIRQHCNQAWTDYDIKEVFLELKEIKNEKLSKKEKHIIENTFEIR